MASLSLYLLTFNCARTLIKPSDFSPHIFDALDAHQKLPDILVLSLQEVAPIAQSFLGGSFLQIYLHAFDYAVRLAAAQASDDGSDDARYINISSKNVGMTAIMVFVRQELVGKVAWVETAGAGVGVAEMGNKGAVGVRVGYETAENEIMEMAFIAAHLAPMEDGLLRRRQDWAEICRRLVFQRKSKKPTVKLAANSAERVPLLQEEELDNSGRTPMYRPTSHLFLAGDLNYRTSDVKPSLDDYESFPQPVEDVQDRRHYASLLKKDQLSREKSEGHVLQGFEEARIDFSPTYKYNTEAQSEGKLQAVKETWNWAKHRWPSWCDRILWLPAPESLGRKIEAKGYTSLPLMQTSDHRPVALSLSVPLRAIPKQRQGEDGRVDVRSNPPFGIDPEWQSKRAAARRLEVVVGLMAYLGLTWEGNTVLLALTVGTVGGWFVLRSLLET